MKYLVVLLVIAVVAWLALRAPALKRPPRKKSRRRELAPALMVRCARCGLHLPRDEALPGAADGFYCSEEHRRLGSNAG